MFKLSVSDFVGAPVNGQTLMPEGANIAIAEWTADGTPPGSEPIWIAPLHIHHEDDEAWYVLEGTLGFQIGEETIEAHANDGVVVPRGTPHTFWNPKEIPARYLIIMTAQIRDLIDAIHSTEQRDPETMKKLFEQYGAELL
ncbi:cupin domain-containing protein [Lederbergia citrea]|uniref:cupin domain-containing protein n=1 Tax=Lederbergia citrea TaxID=2833581 RepID=UPI0020161DA4|nr:cupin domain-containing protein [Lederbergia citrea]